MVLYSSFEQKMLLDLQVARDVNISQLRVCLLHLGKRRPLLFKRIESSRLLVKTKRGDKQGEQWKGNRCQGIF